MGLYLGARVAVEKEGKTVFQYAPMDLFKHLDERMFICDVTEIQFTTLTRKLAKRLDITYDVNFGGSLSKSDLFKFYKETERILRTWSPNPSNEDEYNLELQVRWLHDFVEVCLLNDEIEVSIS